MKRKPNLVAYLLMQEIRYLNRRKHPHGLRRHLPHPTGN